MFEFEPGMFIWTTVSFGILVVLLYKVAIPPLLAMLAQRERWIAETIEEAGSNQKKTQQLLEEQKKKLSEIHRTAEKVLEQARAEGSAARKELLKTAGDQANLILEKARQGIAHEKEKILAEARGEVAEMVIAAAGRVIGRAINDADRARLIEEGMSAVKNG